MATELYYNDGTAVRKARQVYYNDGIAVRTIKEIWYNDGVAVRKVFTLGEPNAAFGGNLISTSASPGIRQVSVTLQTAGTSTAVGGSVQNWFLPTTADVGTLWYVRLTTVTSSSSTLNWSSGSWYLIGAGRTFTFSNNNVNTLGEGTANVAFSQNGSTVDAVAGQISWSAGQAS